ncbi:hypothetical protein [Mycobacterium sp. SMC-19]|uniref:hypothetical protein n=1 Tax=Mycobacterium sp. SMC-19 TaxID=3381630 RepID=UPI003875E4E6
MSAAYERGTPAQQVATHAAAEAAQQNASVMRAQRISADEAYNTGMIALAAKVEQQTLGSRSFVDGPSISARTPNSFGALKPPARTTPGTPAGPRTPAAPGAGTSPSPRTDLSKATMPTMPQVPQGQGAQAQPQPQPQPQQPHPQAAAAGGAPTSTPTPKAADKRRDSDSAPTGLSAAVGATGAGASPVSSAAAPRPTNPGYSVTGMQTATNVTGRPAPGVSLSAGMPTTAPATAAGTAAAPAAGGMGAPYSPMGMGGKAGGAQREAAAIKQGVVEPLEDGIVRGGTVCRGDDEQQKAG